MSALIITGAVVLLLFITLLLVGIHQKNTNAVCSSLRRLDGRTALVTGGTAGMGLELARELARRGARVIVACPAPPEGARALRELRAACPGNPRLRFQPLDLACLRSTRAFAADILASEPRLDILVNNAGVGGPSGATTKDGLNLVMQVNYYGAFLLTILLLPLLKKSGRPDEPSRIITVSSTFHWIGKVTFSNSYYPFTVTPYANSKLFLVLFSRELTKRLKGLNVVINNTDPGAVGTQIFLTVERVLGTIVSFIFCVLFKTPWQGIQTALHVALDNEGGEVSGAYFKNCKQVRSVAKSYNEKLALKVWEESVRLVQLTDQELEESLKPI